VINRARLLIYRAFRRVAKRRPFVLRSTRAALVGDGNVSFQIRGLAA
jgi:hypothetical protein